MKIENYANYLKRVLLLSVLGAVLSLYLVYHHENVVGGYNIGQSFCNIGESFNCDEVAKNSYSSFFGFPVAAFGLCYFLMLSVLSFFISRKKEANHQSAISLVGASALLALIPSILLLLVSVFQIKKFCLFCLLLDLVIVVILLLTMKYINRQNLSQVPRLLRASGRLLVFALPICLSLSLSSPWVFRKFVFEAALKKSVIGQIYSAWQAAPLQEFALNFEADGLKKDFLSRSQVSKGYIS